MAEQKQDEQLKYTYSHYVMDTGCGPWRPASGDER